MEQALGYIYKELGRHERELKQTEVLLKKSRKFNLLAGLVIFALVYKITKNERRIEALECEAEGESD